ncbi:ABC transporter ATP-binding protein [Ottowia sp.]|uniref:ABC transporter ATP-binding protein n=1 Tax=Ottowia sp. TaxID=1898956 RepID=UPI003A86B0E8
MTTDPHHLPLPQHAAALTADGLWLHALQLAYDTPRGLHTVVDGMHLHLPQGRIGCLLGPSGCGKSTVLRAIAGFEPARAGEIRLNGHLLSSPTQHVPPETRHVGLMFQEYALFPHLSAADNVAFGLRRRSRAERDARVRDMLALVGLSDLDTRYPHELSGGQQQRVALARALAPAPALILLDEPFSNLDSATRERLTVEVRDILRSAGQTALLVTHHAAEAHAMADAIGTMHDGRLQNWADAPPP